MLRLYLYARVRHYHHLLHARPRVQQAPGVPCALFFSGRNDLQSPGETRRGNAEVCVWSESLLGPSFETALSRLLRMRSETLMVRSAATPRVSNHEARWVRRKSPGSTFRAGTAITGPHHPR